MKYFVLPAVLLLCLLQPMQGHAQENQEFDPTQVTYLWPTDASPYLSSTFAETRSRHFHAALDIKTWGRRGYNIFATRDGVVHRLGIGPNGYGKVIYLRHTDGSYSVYAHLLAFNKQLQELADSVRVEEGYSFVLDEFVGDQNIQVKQGEVIGYSGASGIGPPHLHFELRTPDHHPFNPLLTNLSVEDQIPPRFVGMSIEPRAIQTAIEGKNAIHTRRARRNGNTFDFGSATVSGPIGLGVNVFDQANDVHNVYAVYELSMSVNGQPVFASRADSFSYRNTHQMFIDRVYPLLHRHREAYQRLYTADGNTLPFYQAAGQQGVLNLAPGSHNITITATDFFGNTSRAHLDLQVESPAPSIPSALNAFPPSDREIAVTPYHWNWFDNWVMIPHEEFQQLAVANSDSSTYYLHKQAMGIDLQKVNNLFLNIPDKGPVRLQRIHPDSVGFVSPVSRHGFARFPEKAFYDTVSIGMIHNQLKEDSIQVDMIPEAYPVREEYEIRIEKDSTLDTTGLSFYKWNRRKMKWNLVPTEFSERYIIGRPHSLGSFTTLRDTLHPELQDPRLSQRADGQWVIIIPAKDELSGLDYERTAITVNGTRGIAEYEPEDDQLVFYDPRFTPPSDMEVTVTAYDRMGNGVTETFLLESSHY